MLGPGLPAENLGWELQSFLEGKSFESQQMLKAPDIPSSLRILKHKYQY